MTQPLMYAQKTLFKEVIECYPDIIDMTYPNLPEYSETDAYKTILFDSVKQKYLFAEIGCYYASEFVEYFRSRWNNTIIEYIPLLKTRIESSFNLNEKRKETGGGTLTMKTDHGKIVDTSMVDSNKTSDTTTRTSNGSTTQYDQQLTKDDTNTSTKLNHEQSHTGDYMTSNSGTDTRTDTRQVNKTVTGVDMINSKIRESLSLILDDFCGEFADLFVEVLNG